MITEGRRTTAHLGLALAALSAFFCLGILPGRAGAQVSALPLNFSDVAIFATNSVRIDNGAQVTSGHVVVNSASSGPTLSPGVELKLGNNAHTPTGYAVAADSISISNGAVVGGNAFFNTLSNSGTINGTQNTPLALPVFTPLPTFKSAPPGTLDVNVPNGAVQTLAAGNYRDIKVLNNATLRIDQGVTNVRSITVSNGGKLLFLNLTSGPSEVRVSEQMTIGNGFFVGPVDSDPLKAGKIVFYVASTSLMPVAVDTGNGGTLYANIYAPNGTLVLDNGTNAVGAFLAKNVDVQNGSHVALESFFTAVPPTITSANATTFTVLQSGTFTVTTTGTPPPSITQSGTLPSGVNFMDNGNGTATLSGIPASGTVGSYPITFMATNPAGADSQNFTLTVAKASQTITFTSSAPSGAAVGGPTYTVTATATSGLAVTFAIDASASSVCSLSGSTVSFIGAGTCVINANQGGNGDYNPAPQAQQSFAVAKGSQTITFTSTAPSGAVYQGPTYTVTATASSGLTVVFTIDASASTVCSISGSTVSFIGAGTCVINANQPGNANYNPAPQVQQSFPVAKASQTITFTSSPPATPTVGGPTYTVTATATSGLTVAFTIDGSASTVCSISGSTVSFIGNGTCVINANQPGDANYNPAPQVQQSFTVKSSQTITFTSSPPAQPTVGGPTYLVTATATSGLTVTFTIDPSASTVCSISGSTVSFIGAGACVINANQAGNANFYPAPQVQQSFGVKNAQTITFTSTAPSAAVYQGPTYTVTATASSGLTVTFTIDASATSVCSIAGSVVSFIGTGTCVIDANQAGNASFYPAPQAQQSFSVGPNLADNAYSVVGNTQLVAAGQSSPPTPFTADAASLLANDTSDAAITVTAVTNAATTGGGSITIDAAGAFTYTPLVGQSSGTDTYVYTGTANGVSRTATVTFNIANIVWYVDNTSTGAHDGRSNTPFTNMGAGANGLGTALSGTGPAAGAFIYVHKGSGATTGAYTFKVNQALVGAGATLNVPPVSPLLTVAGSAANTPTLDSGLTLASGVSMIGLHMDGSTVNLTGTSITGFSVNVGRFRRTGSSAATAISLGGAGNTGTFDFASVSATGVSGSSTSKGVAIANLTGHFNVAGTDVALTPDGGSVSGYGGNGLEFVSVTNGAATSVSLKNMSIVGNGQTQAVAGSSTSCGGDLVGGNNLSCVANLFVQNSKNVSLDTVTVTGSGQQGINGSGVDGLIIANSTIDGNGNESFENGILLRNPLGTVAITGTSVRDNRARQLHMANGSGAMIFNSSASQYGHASAGTGTADTQQGILMQLTGTSNTTVNATTLAFANNEGSGFTTNAFQINADNGGPVVNGSVSSSTFDNHAAAVIVNAGGTANVTFDTLNNPTMTNSTLQAINYSILGGSAAITAKITGTIQGNVINGCQPAGGNCHGIDLNTGSNQNGELHLKIHDNTIQQTAGGILMLATGSTLPGTATAHLKITSNDISNPGNINGRSAIELQGALSSTTPNITLCTDVGGAGDENVISGQWNQAGAQAGIFIRQRFSPANSWVLPGYTGPANNGGGQVETYLNGRNTNSATPVQSLATTTTGAFANGGACVTP